MWVEEERWAEVGGGGGGECGLRGGGGEDVGGGCGGCGGCGGLVRVCGVSCVVCNMYVACRCVSSRRQASPMVPGVHQEGPFSRCARAARASFLLISSN